MDFATYQQLIEQNKHKSENSIVARFYDRVVKTGKTSKNGMPIFKNICYCEIRIKDNTTEIYDQPATEDKYARFPVEYARYQLSRKKSETGTPLEQFAFLTVAEIETCKYRGILTVEDLAALSKEHATDLGLTAEVAQAKLFLQKNAGLQQDTERSKLIEKYEDKIKSLEAELAGLKQSNKRRKKQCGQF